MSHPFQDRLLRGLIKNSSYVLSSNVIVAALTFGQTILATNLLGMNGYGLVSGTIIVFASNINRLLSFRMSELVVKYLGQALVAGDKPRAGAVVKGAALVEGATSVLAYLVLLALAPLAALYFAKDVQTVPLFAFYGVILLTNIVYETSTGVLQATRRFDRVAAITVTQSILTAGLILAAFLLHGGVFHVLLAYVVGKTVNGLGVAWLAYRQLQSELGPGWQRASLHLLPDWRAMVRFAASTNLHGTVNLIVRDSESLIVGLFWSPTEAGYFRLAQGLINLLVMPIDPLIAPTYAEISRTIAQRQWDITRRLLKRVSALVGAWTLAAGGGLALLGWWLIPLVYGADAAPVYPAVLLLLIGYGFTSIVQWNRSLLLTLGMAGYPLAVGTLVGLVKTALTFGVVPGLGYLAEAGVLSAYFVISNGVIVLRGLAELKARQQGDAA